MDTGDRFNLLTEGGDVVVREDGSVQCVDTCPGSTAGVCTVDGKEWRQSKSSF